MWLRLIWMSCVAVEGYRSGWTAWTWWTSLRHVKICCWHILEWKVAFWTGRSDCRSVEHTPFALRLSLLSKFERLFYVHTFTKRSEDPRSRQWFYPQCAFSQVFRKLDGEMCWIYYLSRLLSVRRIALWRLARAGCCLVSVNKGNPSWVSAFSSCDMPQHLCGGWKLLSSYLGVRRLVWSLACKLQSNWGEKMGWCSSNVNLQQWGMGHVLKDICKLSHFSTEVWYVLHTWLWVCVKLSQLILLHFQRKVEGPISGTFLLAAFQNFPLIRGARCEILLHFRGHSRKRSCTR